MVGRSRRGCWEMVHSDLKGQNEVEVNIKLPISQQ